jgi:GTPase SAR1 family protein
MRIAITGAHKVGKTSLINELREAFPDYEFKAEPYYELEEQGFSFSEVPTGAEYLTLLKHSIEQLTSSGDNVVFDRCPVDILAYVQAEDELDSSDLQSWYNKVKEVMKEIDILVFIPVEKPDLIGCAKSDLPKLRLIVNEILYDWVRDFNLNTIEVTGSVSERKNQLINQISKIKW